jgi:hypothetical protein
MSMVGARMNLSVSDLRPTAVRSVLERRIMTASTPIVRYYDHLRFVYEVESRMKELRRSTEIERQNQTPSQNRVQPDGESRHKDGGTRNGGTENGGTGQNPNEAPQQTVNPPVSLWGSDIQEAQLSLEQTAPERVPAQPGLIAVSEMVRSNTGADVLATPERSTPCLA